MATTYNFTDGSIAGVPKATESTLKETEPMILRQIVDFSLQNLDASEGDIAQVLNIPADTVVLNAYLRVMTLDSANSTVDLGVTTTNEDQWGGALSLAAADVMVGGLLAAPLYFADCNTMQTLQIRAM